MKNEEMRSNPHNGKKWKFKRKRKNKPIDIFPATYNPVLGEMRLWQAVIMQAMMDAISKGGNSEMLYHRNTSVHWLTERNADFADVCYMAGFNPDVIRRSAKKTISTPSPWRADAGKGWRYEERKAHREKKKQAKHSQPECQDAVI